MKEKISRMKLLAIFSTLIMLFIILKCGNYNNEQKGHPKESAPEGEAKGLQKVIIILAVKDIASYKKIESAVKNMGGRVTAGAPPEIILGLIPPEKESELSSLPEIRLITSKPLELEKLKGITEKEKELLKQWNQRLSKTPEPTLIPNPPPPPNDALERPPIKMDEIEVKPPKSLPAGMENGNTFLFENMERSISPELTALTVSMSGKVAAMVFFPESNGAIDPNQENWAVGQKNNVIYKILLGMDWWASLAPVSQNLSFQLFRLTDPSYEATSYEPITRPHTDGDLWVDQIMTNLGYTSGDSFTKVDSFNTWLKSYASADETFSIFVVNDELDADHMFSDVPCFAFAFRGGPLMVLTYENDGYGISYMDAVFAHENGHIFWSWDEYASSSCTCSQNYNGAYNQNCENGCLDNVSCIMRSGVDPYIYNSICDCTKGQIGWGSGICGSQGTGCTAGTCCNPVNGLPKPPYSVCGSTTEYICMKGSPKGKCGDDVYQRQVIRQCSGMGLDCSGAATYGNYSLHQACSSKQVCSAITHSCKRSSICSK